MKNPSEPNWNEEDAVSVPNPRRLEPVGEGGAAGGPPPDRVLRGAWTPHPAKVREFSVGDLSSVVRHVARVVGRHWWIGLLLAGAELALFLVYMSARRPTVTAEATLVAQSALDEVLNRGITSGADDPERRENIMRNHLALMTSRRFRLDVARSLSAEEARAVQAPYLEPGETPSLDRLQEVLAGDVRVERERGRELFTVRATHPDPTVALMLADRYSEGYLDYARDDLRDANGTARSALESEAEETNQRIQELEGKRLDFQRRFSEITGGGGREVIQERITSLNNALSQVRVQRAQAEVQLRQAEADMEESPTPFNNPTLAAYGNTAELRADIDRRKAERAMLAGQYGPNHPKLQEADRGIESVQTALRNNFAVALSELRARVALATSEESKLGAQLSQLIEKAGEVDQVAAELATLDQRIVALRDTHSDLLHQIAQAGIARELPTDVMRVVDHAYVPKPLLPPKVVLSVVGVGGAFFCFILGPLLWHSCNRRVSSTWDLELLLNTELLGVVPRMPWMWSAQRPHVVRRGRRTAAVEAFLGTASQFELRSPAGCPRRIVISSTLPGEGKSVVASNLAAAFTRLGYRALLVDCDFRRPSQHRFHRCANNVGLLHWIEQGCPGGAGASLETIGVHALPGGTWLLPTGGTDPEPARNFLLPEVAALFDRLGREFDVTIIDTSPAGLFPDPFFVSRFADATALVVREGMASLDQVRKVIADFTRTSAPVSGIIFNAIAGGITHPSFGYRTVAAKYARHYGDGARRLPARTHNRPAAAVEPVAG